MTYMNAVRVAISVFLVALIVISARGWIWTGDHQSAGQSSASRIVLGLCIVAGIVGLTALWRHKPAK